MSAQRRSWLLLLLPAVACSLTLNVNKLSDGCEEGLVLCNGECMEASACLLPGGGSGGSSGSDSGGNAAGGNSPTSGTGGLDTAGAAGAAEVCTSVPFPFAYDPLLEPDTVHVTGSFITWSEPGIEMTEDSKGVYRVVVDLPLGRHTYKFLMNGEQDEASQIWAHDPYNPENESDGFGTQNSILVIECGVTYTPFGPDGTGGAAGAGGASGAGGADGAGGATSGAGGA